jgi:hypothetical protein
MPTGTLANHLAIRQLCGVKPRAVVPEQAISITTPATVCRARVASISALAKVVHFTPTSCKKSQRAMTDRYSQVAVLIESPVRRQHGQIMPTRHGSRDQLPSSPGPGHAPDGARLYMMRAPPVSVRNSTPPF